MLIGVCSGTRVIYDWMDAHPEDLDTPLTGPVQVEVPPPFAGGAPDPGAGPGHRGRRPDPDGAVHSVDSGTSIRDGRLGGAAPRRTVSL